MKLSRYALKLVSNIRSIMEKFSLGLSSDLVLEYKGAILNNNIDMSRLVVYIQQVDDEKKNSQRLSKKAKHVD